LIARSGFDQRVGKKMIYNPLLVRVWNSRSTIKFHGSWARAKGIGIVYYGGRAPSHKNPDWLMQQKTTKKKVAR
jgi:hypothetical protein